MPLKFLPSSFHLPFHSRVFSYSISLPVRRFSSPFHSLFSPRFHDDSAVGKIFVDAGTPSPIRPNFTNIRGRINAASLNDDVSGRPPLLHSLRRRCTRTFRANENGYHPCPFAFVHVSFYSDFGNIRRPRDTYRLAIVKGQQLVDKEIRLQ